MKATKLAMVIGFVFSGIVHAEAEDWRNQTDKLFQDFAQALEAGKYSALFEVFDRESSDHYRKLMLAYYETFKTKPAVLLPEGKDGKQLSLAELRRLTNEEFWDAHITYFKKRETVTSKILKEAHSPLGMPKYKLRKAFRDGDFVFMIVDKSFDIPSPVPLPYEVLEAVLEGGQWRLRVPRLMLWQTHEDTMKATQRPEARQ